MAQVVWEEGTDPPQLLAATLSFLVERVLDPSLTGTFRHHRGRARLAPWLIALDPSAAVEFLLIFPAFTTGIDLLEADVLKAENELKATLAPGIREHHELVKFDIKKKKIIDFLHLWIFDHWIDFRSDPNLLQQLQSLLKNTMEPNCPKGHLKNFMTLLAKKQESGTDHPPKRKRNVHSPPTLFKGGGKENVKKNAATIADLLPEEIARQLTLREAGLYGLINVRELIRQAWNKKGNEEKCKNVLTFIGNFNRISFLVQTEVLRIIDAKERGAAFGVWITVAEKCRDLKNYNAVMEIISALGSSSISRLNQSWALVPEDRKQALTALQQLTKRTSNFKELRVAMDSATGACVPYIGMYLGDLTFIEDGNMLRSDFDQSLIHFSKWKLAANVIQKIQSFQRLGYVFEELPSIQLWLASGEACDEKTLYQMSLQLEARGSMISDPSKTAAAPAPQVARSQELNASTASKASFVRRITDTIKRKDTSSERTETRSSPSMSISFPIGRSETTTIGSLPSGSGDAPNLSPRGKTSPNTTPPAATATTPGSPSVPMTPRKQAPPTALPPVPPTAVRDKSPMPVPPTASNTNTTATTPSSSSPARASTQLAPVPAISLSTPQASSSPPTPGNISPRSAASTAPPASPRGGASGSAPATAPFEDTTEKPDLLLADAAAETVNPDVKKCAKCQKAIDGGYIIAESKPYHDKCFTCSFCHRQLDSFVSCKLGSTDQFFCMEHAELASPPIPCGVCKENIKPRESYILVDEQEMHSKCFKCARCSTQLKSFVKILSMYYCPPCADKQEHELAHLRAKPLPPAPGKQPRAHSSTDLPRQSDSKDHPPLLGDRPKAASTAGADMPRKKPEAAPSVERNAGSLDSPVKDKQPEKEKEKPKESNSSGGISGFFNKTMRAVEKKLDNEKEKDEKKDKEKADAEAAAPKPDPGPPTGKTCVGCKQAIFGTYSLLSQQPYHPTCIKCSVCKLELSGQGICMHEGKLLCQEHYNKKALPRCANCKEPITGAFINALGKSWHKQCMVCYKCKKDVSGGLYERDGKPVCLEHAKK